MKIVFLLPSLRGGGAEKVFTSLVSKFFKEGHYVELILLQKEGAYLSQVDQSIPIHDLKLPHARHALKPIKQCLAKLKPDIVYSTHDRMNVLNILSRKVHNGKVFVRQISYYSHQLKTYPYLIRYPLHVIFKLLYHKANGVISQGMEMNHDIIQRLRLNPQKTFIVYNPLNLDYTHQPIERFKSFSRDKKHIISVGRLSREKGFDLLLHALRQLDVEKSQYHLHICGEGPERESLENIIKAYGLKNKITFHGFVQNVFDFYKQADIFVLASRREGFPNALIEAMHYGLTCVSSDCMSGPKEIIEHGVNGYLFRNDDVNDLAEKLLMAIKKPLKQVGTDQRFSIDHIYQEYLELFLKDT